MLLRGCARCLSTPCSRVVDRRFNAAGESCSDPASAVYLDCVARYYFSRLSRRVGGGAHRASEESWSSETSSTSWSSWKLQRWPALAPTHGRSKSPLGLTGLLLVSGDPGHDKNTFSQLLCASWVAYMPAGYIVQAQGRHGAVLRQARGNHELEVRGPSARLGLLLPHTTTTTSQNPHEAERLDPGCRPPLS